MRHEVRSNFNESQSPRVSVVVNVWGGDEPVSLKRSLSSINSQRQSPDEVVIVIDGPISGELEEEIQSFKNRATCLVKAIYIPSPKGLWNARNVGIGEAENEIVALHDADDVMHPERLKIQLTEMVYHSADLYFTPAVEFNTKSGEVTGCRVSKQEVVDLHVIFWNNILNHSSVLFKRDAILDIGGYRNVYFSEDYDLWLRLIIAGKRVRQSKMVLQALGVDSGHLDRRSGFQFVKAENSIHRMIKDTQEFPSLTLLIRRILRLMYRLGPNLIRKMHRGKLNSRKAVAFPKTLTEFLDSNPVNRESHL
jgi:glycosyltransferase involved in cell wall biosynthesis